MKKGESMSQEQKEKIRQSNLGKKRSPETKARVREWVVAHPVKFWLGKTRSQEDRQKFSMSHKGRSLPLEQRVKIGIGVKDSPAYRNGMINRRPWKGGLMKKPGHLSWLNHQYRIRRRGADGSHTLEEWNNLKAQFNWTCPRCLRREPEIVLTKDHIRALSTGGSDNIENIQPMCRSCNSSKHTKTIRYELNLETTVSADTQKIEHPLESKET